MTPIVALVAISFGIQLSTKIISFIADQSTMEEVEKHNQLLKEYNRIINERNLKRSKMVQDLKECYLDENQIQEATKHEVLELFRNEAENRIQYVKETLLTDISEALETIKLEKAQYNSSIRHNSFILLRSELQEAKQKAKAYIQYLDYYKRQLPRIYDCCTDEKDIIFSFTIPKDFPYNGKVIFLSRDSFDHTNGIGRVILHKCVNVEFYISDYDFFKKEPLNNFAVMCDGFDKITHRYEYSIQHGRYKQVVKSGGFNGIIAKVDGYKSDGRTITLKYGKDMVLDLNAKNLYNFYRYPAIGSEITVYPIEETYSRAEKRMVYKVSQRQEDAEISLDFKRLPLILSEDKTAEFCNYIEQNNLNFNISYDNVKVAPISNNGDDVSNPKAIKLQVDGQYNSFTMVLEIKSKDNKQYLWFDRFIDDTRLSPEDIFIPFNAEIDIMFELDFDNFLIDKSNKDAFDNMNNLVLTIFKEFNLQHKLRNSQDGMRYFSAWENIVSALKKFVEKSNPIVCKIDDIPKYTRLKNKGIKLNFKVSNADSLKRYYEKMLSEQENTHFIADFFIEYKKIYYIVKINENCESFDVLIPQFETDENENINIADQLSLLSEITIYKRNSGVPEQRQLQALHKFKIGCLYNSNLQTYMLNGQHIIPQCTNKVVDKLYNESLKENQSQYNSLIRSLNEENLFFIQGPPGTGKTTVIRELVAQTILENPQSKVLIVSQANVAVDNVIKGLVRNDMPFTEKDIIRCGRSGKISAEISNMSYEKKYDDYIDEITNISLNSPDIEVRNLASEWLHKIKSSYGYNPDVGELIIRNHKIIGATCVGLSQKKIGIDKLVFDLVIIDEAGKALAPEIVIPMVQAKKAVIIGDHKQLPAVINPALYDAEKIELDERQYCKQEIFDISYFQRMFESCPNTNKSTLDTQYRMPSVIGTMVSKLFYDGKLQNGIGTDLKKPIYGNSNLTIVDMSSEKQYIENDKSSPINDYEAQYVLHLLKSIKAKNDTVKVAVITPYKGQKAYIKRLLINNGFDYRQKNVHIDTVDSFQGDEADIVIYCTTRAKKKTQFLSDRRRINVAISRTRNEFIMIASTKYLSSYANKESIKQVLQYIQKYGDIVPPDSITKEKITINREIIRISDLIVNKNINFKASIKDKIKHEVDYFNRYGHFSCYPIVDKSDDFYLIINHEEVYYSAIELSLSEIFVELNKSANVNKVNIEKSLHTESQLD